MSKCLLLAENYVRVPQPLYARLFENESRNVLENLKTNLKSLSEGFKSIEKIFREVLYFDEYINEKNLILKMFADISSSKIQENFMK